jgi:hypothetical protein
MLLVSLLRKNNPDLIILPFSPPELLLSESAEDWIRFEESLPPFIGEKLNVGTEEGEAVAVAE